MAPPPSAVETLDETITTNTVLSMRSRPLSRPWELTCCNKRRRGEVLAMPDTSLTTTCAIAGGGPAGMMLGFLLARAGIDVVVLEKYPDFFRDFRGDTVHPSTLELMYELGLLE